MAADSTNFGNWLAKANNDLLAARGILNYYEDPPTDTVCYHAHQVAEKALKGFVISRSGSLAKTHDLVELLNRAGGGEKALKELADDIQGLNKYYIETRYPPDLPVIYSVAEAKEAVLAAEKVIKVVGKLLTGSQTGK